jgi:hypothetical protein
MRRAVARGRVFPQGYSTDRRYGRLSLKSIGLFPLLWANGDDQGRLCGDPEEVKYTCCPNVDHITKADIPELLAEMQQNRLIAVYTTPDSSAIQLLDWWRVQRPQWAYPSEYPPPEGWRDHLRYHLSPSEIVTENWVAPGQLERGLPKALPSTLPGALANELGSALAKELPGELGNSPKGPSGGSSLASGSTLPKELPKEPGNTEKRVPGSALPNELGNGLASKPEAVPSPLTPNLLLPPLNIFPEISGIKNRDVEDEEGRLPSALPSTPGSTERESGRETGPPPGRGEKEPALSQRDREIISIWRSVKGFKLAPAAAATLAGSLRSEFPEVDLLGESKRWAARKLSEPLKDSSRPSQQIWNWMEMARKINRAGRMPDEKRAHQRGNGEKPSGAPGPWYAGSRR